MQNPAKFLWKRIISTNFSKPEKLRFLFVAIIIGIWSGQWEFFPKYLLLVGTLLLVTFFWWKKFLVVIFAGFLLTNYYAQWRNFADFKTDNLPQFIGQEVQITGKVVTFPDVREKNTRVIVEALLAKTCDLNQCQQNSAKISGKFLLVLPESGLSSKSENSSPDSKKLDYGNKIIVQGRVTYPSSFSSDFDYRKYLKRFGVQTIIKNPKTINILEREQGNWLLQKAKISRNLLEKNLENGLPSPHQKIAMGVLLGVKNELPKWTQADFKNSGLQHLLVVSGTNVTIVIIAIGFLLRRFGRRISFTVSLLALLFFVLMTGADAPVLRASIMGAVVGWSVAWGKMSNARNIVLFSAVIIGLFSPLVLQNDIGFALSFGATLGIIIGFPMFEKLFRGISLTPSLSGLSRESSQKEKFSFIVKKFIKILLSILAISLSAQITILPILVKSFGQFPLGGIPANLFSEPLMPFIMFFSFISSIAGILPIMIARIISIPAYILLEILLQIAHIFAKIPNIIIPNFLNYVFTGFILLIIFYGLFSRDFEERFLILEK